MSNTPSAQATVLEIRAQLIEVARGVVLEDEDIQWEALEKIYNLAGLPAPKAGNEDLWATLLDEDSAN